MRLVDDAYGGLEMAVLSVVSGEHSELGNLRERAEETTSGHDTRCVSFQGSLSRLGFDKVLLDSPADSSISGTCLL